MALRAVEHAAGPIPEARVTVLEWYRFCYDLGHFLRRHFLRIFVHYTHNISGEPPPVAVKGKKKVVSIDESDKE